ncbi:hypothetical protein SARC_00049 [Sphaeroforma arctica JP610]|uniref:SDE2-like domain-containing protein n=1 Tax=Sphaeroforma arctica JP610 TaxID=667725 RepID=A0A0L0GG40_9EUKA|nr:hypothetical protein SARC_00049 [Sphaeroforma arctica JP610]KNC87791.1 hypothetical protein SARC_00049 [Sphaeroforma arctica JP610]|eukprot:XP_014161693.1 hypothetical protein SARC_00049 [Sphaeroforma arctica JP610]
MLMMNHITSLQKETTNFEACRDLNGQRLRNVHDQETMVDFLKKTEEREKEREELKKKKQEQLTRGPLHAFDHQAHGTEVRDAKEKVNEALNEALKKRKFEGDEEATASKKVKAKKLKIWGDDDDLSGSDSDSDSGSDGEKDEKAASLVTTTTSSTSTTATSKQTSLTAVEG